MKTLTTTVKTSEGELTFVRDCRGRLSVSLGSFNCIFPVDYLKEFLTKPFPQLCAVEVAPRLALKTSCIRINVEAVTFLNLPDEPRSTSIVIYKTSTSDKIQAMPISQFLATFANAEVEIYPTNNMMVFTAIEQFPFENTPLVDLRNKFKDTLSDKELSESIESLLQLKKIRVSSDLFSGAKICYAVNQEDSD